MSSSGAERALAPCGSVVSHLPAILLRKDEPPPPRGRPRCRQGPPLADPGPGGGRPRPVSDVPSPTEDRDLPVVPGAFAHILGDATRVVAHGAITCYGVPPSDGVGVPTEPGGWFRRAGPGGLAQRWVMGAFLGDGNGGPGVRGRRSVCVSRAGSIEVRPYPDYLWP
jgi:hypothetical protein